jgi:arylformamidase
MNKTYDVTVPLSAEVPTYPGDPPVEVAFIRRIADGHPCNVSKLTLGAHAGTHVDAPYHFLADGATIAELPLEILLGKTRVLELPVRDRVRREDLEKLDLRDDLRILFKTRMSGQMRVPAFQEDYVYLTAEAATYLVQAGLKLVGIDYLSIDRFGSVDYPVHHTLLGAGIVIVEGLDLSQVDPGEYDMTCLPLRVAGGEGAPARVILRARS